MPTVPGTGDGHYTSPPVAAIPARRFQAANRPPALFVGWSMADHMASRLVVGALGIAVQRQLPGEGLLAHSDRGSQHASEHYQLLLAKRGIACSMSRRADCWDNATMESFFVSLEKV